MQKIKSVHECDIDIFDKKVNELLTKGYQISSTSCGFVNSEQYDFTPSHHAILVLDNEPSFTEIELWAVEQSKVLLKEFCKRDEYHSCKGNINIDDLFNKIKRL